MEKIYHIDSIMDCIRKHIWGDLDNSQPPSQMVSKGTGDASLSKQFLRIRPVGGSAKMREPVQVSTACHFVTGAFSASDPYTL